MVKSVFDSLGHYARWDLVGLTTPPAPYEPIAAAQADQPPSFMVERVVDSVAKEFRLEPERVDEIVRGVVAPRA